MNQQPSAAPPESNKAAGSGSAVRRFAGFVVRHPIGVLQLVFFSLVAIVILQNLESTSIDVLFWSVPALPKLVLIFFSMLVGASAWELACRWFRR